jgi:hypothetical protein
MVFVRRIPDHGPDDDPAVVRADEGPIGKPTERPFDVWLRRQLHSLYDDIVREPLPAKLLAALQRGDTGNRK